MPQVNMQPHKYIVQYSKNLQFFQSKGPRSNLRSEKKKGNKSNKDPNDKKEKEKKAPP